MRKGERGRDEKETDRQTGKDTVREADRNRQRKIQTDRNTERQCFLLSNVPTTASGTDLPHLHVLPLWR